MLINIAWNVPVPGFFTWENANKRNIVWKVIKKILNGKEYQKWAYFDEKVNEINEIISTIMLSRCHNANSGELVIKIKAIDKAGNSSESEPLTLYRDSRAPEIKDVRIETASNLLDKIVSFFMIF